jgi:hypothetical protein
MRTLNYAVTLLVALSSAAFAADEPVTKEVTGEAPIIEGNKQRAQEVAKDNALRTAVEQVAGTLISATTLTQNSQLISDQILSHSAGYVSKWQPVGKPVEEGGVMKVTVRATVATAQLDKDLMAVQALIDKLGNRKEAVPRQRRRAGGGQADRRALQSGLHHLWQRELSGPVDRRHARQGLLSGQR